MDKIAITKWKKEYHNLSKDKQSILRSNVMKDSGLIAKGVERGNQNLMKRYGVNEIIDDRQFQSIRKHNGKMTIFSPSSLADFDPKNSTLSKADQKLIGAFNTFSGVKKLSPEDKALFNATGKRNALNKEINGFSAQMIGEGGFAPYYSNQSFPKKLKVSRMVAFPDREGKKEIFKNYGKKIDVNSDIIRQKNKDFHRATINHAAGKPYEAFRLSQKSVSDNYYSNKKKYDELARNLTDKKGLSRNAKIGLGVGAGALLGYGAYKGIKKMKKKRDYLKQKEQEEKSASQVHHELAIEKNAI